MKITYKNKKIEIKEPITVNKLLEEEINKNEYQVVACRYNNDYRNLETEIKEDAQI